MSVSIAQQRPTTYSIVGATLAVNWWAFAVRGILGVLFGLIALFLPGATMLSFVLLFAAYASVDGVFGIAGAVRDARQGGRCGFLVVAGLIDIYAAANAALWPAMTVIGFVLLLAGWAMLTGGLMLSASFRLQGSDGRWWFALSGVVSIIYGALLALCPMIGALVLTWWLGAYALVFGISLLVAAFRLKAQLGRMG